MVTSRVPSATSTVSCSLADLSFINLSAALEWFCPVLCLTVNSLILQTVFSCFTLFFLVEETSVVKQITIY